MVSRYNFTVPLCISQTTGVSVVLVQRFKNHPSSMPQSEVALCLGLPGLTGPTLRCQAFATCLHKTRAVHPGNPQTSRQHTSLCADAHWTCPKKSDKLTGFAQRLGVHPPRCRHGLHGHLHALQNKLESRLMLQGLPAPVYRRFCLIATMTVLLWNCCWLPCLSLVRTSSQHSHVSSWIACQNGDGQYQKAQK